MKQGFLKKSKYLFLEFFSMIVQKHCFVCSKNYSYQAKMFVLIFIFKMAAYSFLYSKLYQA